jgi:hypothetical protein
VHRRRSETVNRPHDRTLIYDLSIKERIATYCIFDVGSLFSYKSLSTRVPAGCASLRPHPPPRGASYRAGRRARGTAHYPRQLVHMRSHAILPRPMPNRAEHAPTRARTHRTAHPRPRTTDHTRPPSEMTTEKQKTVVLLVGRLCTPIGRL